MAYKNGYRLWDDEYEQAHWTPEEVAAIDILPMPKGRGF